MAVAMAVRGITALRAASRHGPSAPPPWPVYRVATSWPTPCPWSARATASACGGWREANCSCNRRSRAPAAGASSPRTCRWGLFCWSLASPCIRPFHRGPLPWLALILPLVCAWAYRDPCLRDAVGWSIGSLLFVALLVFTGKPNKSDWLMLAVCIAVFGPFFFYYYSGGPDFGARYWYLMLVPLVALTIRGIDFLQSTREQSSTSVLIAVGVLSLLTLLNYFPWRTVDKYRHFWDMRPDVRELAKQYNFGKSLVLVRAQT